MKRLEDMSLGHRVALTLVIVLIILFALAAFGYFGGRWDQAEGAPAHELYEGIQPDEKLLSMDRRALDEAYHQQLLHLWNIWLKQQAGDPTAFTNGLRIARRAYGQAAQELDKREKAILERKQ
jgi:hypothetical protein